jgi:hypothetical protein
MPENLRRMNFFWEQRGTDIKFWVTNSRVRIDLRGITLSAIWRKDLKVIVLDVEPVGTNTIQTTDDNNQKQENFKKIFERID